MVDRPSYFFQISDNQNQTCIQEITPLMVASYKGSVHLVKTLLKKDADPLRATLKGGRNSFTFSVLSKVSADINREILELLMEKVISKYDNIDEYGHWT